MIRALFVLLATGIAMRGNPVAALTVICLTLMLLAVVVPAVAAVRVAVFFAARCRA